MKTVEITHKEQAIKLLKRARKQLGKFASFGICSAIDSAITTYKTEELALERKSLWATRNQLVHWIHSNLGGYAFYNSWLRENSEEFRKIYYPSSQRKAMKALKEGRLAWIDWMISELERLLPPEGETHFPLGRAER